MDLIEMSGRSDFDETIERQHWHSQCHPATDSSGPTPAELFWSSVLLGRTLIDDALVLDTYQLTLIDAEEGGLHVHENTRTASSTNANVLSVNICVNYGSIVSVNTADSYPSINGFDSVRRMLNDEIVVKVPRYGVHVVNISVVHRHYE